VYHYAFRSATAIGLFRLQLPAVATMGWVVTSNHGGELMDAMRGRLPRRTD
jgi:hypothetical protein